MYGYLLNIIQWIYIQYSTSAKNKVIVAFYAPKKLLWEWSIVVTVG